MFNKIVKLFTNYDVLFIDKFMKVCSENNVSEFKMDFKSNYIEVIFENEKDSQ